MNTQHQSEKGIIAITLVLIVASIITVFGLSVALMAIDGTRTATTQLSASQSAAYDDACVTNALSVLINNNSYTGNANISVGNVNCIAVIANPGGNVRSIKTSATATDAFARSIVDRSFVNVNIATNPFTVLYYKDILD